MDEVVVFAVSSFVLFFFFFLNNCHKSAKALIWNQKTSMLDILKLIIEELDALINHVTAF